MRYLELQEKMRPFVVFSLRDIRKVNIGFDNRRLVEWQEKGYLKKIIKGYYLFSDTTVTDLTLFLVANKIYTPSYVSLEMGLSYYKIIPESVYVTTSITTKKTQSFTTPLGNFHYRTVKREAMFGYTYVAYEHLRVKVGEVEKVVLDYLYLHPEVMAVDDLEALRWNKDSLKEAVDFERLDGYLPLFDTKTLYDRVGLLREFLKGE
jgi:predicted transcriptional regulator of viral defense system